MKQEQLKVTSPEEYAVKAQQASAGDNAGFLYKLKKTGAVVRLRHVDMEALAILGSLPMSLVAAATKAEVETDDKKSDKKKQQPKPTQEQIDEGVKTAIFMRQMVVENCLEPPIRYEEGVGVFFVGSDFKPVARVDKDDFIEMFEIISGAEGADGLNSFRNRKTRRASAAKSRSKTLRPRSVSTEDERQPAQA